MHDNLVDNQNSLSIRIYSDGFSVFCETDLYTLIPEVFCNTETMRSFLKLQHPDLPENWQVHQSTLENQQSVLVYALSENLLSLVDNTFNQSDIKHHLQGVIDKLVASNEDMIIVWVRQQKVDFVVYKENSICLLNSYDYKTSEDIVYHALNIYHQFKLDPETFKITTYSHDKTQLELLIKKYITNADCKSIQSEYEDYQRKI